MFRKAIAVLLSLFILSVIFGACAKNGRPGSNGADDSPYNGESPSADAIAQYGDGTTEYNPLVPETTKKQGKTYKVTFYTGGNEEGTTEKRWFGSNQSQDEVAKVDAVEKHDSATPPIPELAPGKVFVKWDTDFSDITKDVEVHAVTEDVAERPNVIAAQGTYGQQGKTVYMPLMLCGVVNLAGVDITVTYDKEALTLESVFNEDGGVLYNTDTPGEISLNYVSTGNTTADVDLCSLKFTVKAASGEYAVKTQINSIYAYNDADELYHPEYTVIDANVYVYQ